MTIKDFYNYLYEKLYSLIYKQNVMKTKLKLAFTQLENEMEKIPASEIRRIIGGSTTVFFSNNGATFVQGAEGFSSSIYYDSAGNATIGYGHKLTAADIANGTYSNGITQGQAAGLLCTDAVTTENAIGSMVNVNLSQNEYDALVSFVYNVGNGNFSGSELLAKLNNGDKSGAADEMSNWVYAGGDVQSGLQTRREQEIELFSGGDYDYFH